METCKERYSSYLNYLPELYSSGPESESLERFLNIFKSVLTENTADTVLSKYLKTPHEGIEELLDRVHEFFNPYLAPGARVFNKHTGESGVENHLQRNFLSWLADWVGFAYKVYFDEKTLRRVIPQVIPLYGMRGTREGLTRMIEMFSGKGSVKMYETPREKIQFSAYLKSEANKKFFNTSNYVFGLRIDLTKSLLVKDYRFSGESLPDREHIDYLITLFRNVICLEKPAHTDVMMVLHVSDGIQIAVTSTIAYDTRIGFGMEITETTASLDLA